MYNDLLTIGSFTIHTYGLMTGIGIIAAYLSTEYRAKKNKLDESKVFGLVIWCLIFGYICSKLLYWTTILPSIIADPSLILRTIADGWVVYGGLLGGILGAVLYCRREKIPTFKYFDIGLASVALAQGFGRIGCFFAGCCYGIESDSIIAITFTGSSFAPNGVALIPTQLISSALDFLLFGFLVLLYKRKKHIPGQCAAAYLICYSGGRFILEFFRGDVARGSVGVLSTSQFIAIFTFAAGVAALCAVNKRGDVYGVVRRRAAIFDLDGTLLNTIESIARPTNTALTECGYEERPLEAYKAYIGDGYRKCVERALADFDVTDEAEIDRVFEIGSRLYAEDPTYNVQVYENMAKALKVLKERGMSLAVITNKPHVSAPKVVSEFFGDDLFDMVQGQQDGVPKKPDPKCVSDIMAKLRVAPKDCAYFGDSNTDMQLGKAAGFYTVGVSWGFRSRSELEENKADIVIDKPEQITEVC